MFFFSKLVFIGIGYFGYGKSFLRYLVISTRSSMGLLRGHFTTSHTNPRGREESGYHETERESQTSYLSSVPLPMFSLWGDYPRHHCRFWSRFFHGRTYPIHGLTYVLYWFPVFSMHCKVSIVLSLFYLLKFFLFYLFIFAKKDCWSSHSRRLYVE